VTPLLRTNAILNQPRALTASAQPEAKPWDFVVKFEVVGLAFRQLEPGDVCLRKLHGVGPGALASGNWEAYGKHARDYP
jgi:hypothetical protein